MTQGSASYPQWGLSWTYDRYGNRTAQSVTNGSGPSNAVTVSATTNRITDPGYSYDANGNMTADGLNSLTYDGESRLVTSSSSTYSYDGNSLRVKKCIPNCTSPTSTTVYIFSGSKVIAEYENGAAPAAPTHEYIYSGAQLLATIAGSTTTYHHADHITVRASSDGTAGSPTFGQKIGDQGHYPYGESWYLQNTTTKWQFTSYERDGESGNDYAMFRTYINRLGRFSSPDLLAGSAAAPQSLNRYAYVLNDPVNLFDPWGLVCACVEGRLVEVAGVEGEVFICTRVLCGGGGEGRPVQPCDNGQTRDASGLPPCAGGGSPPQQSKPPAPQPPTENPCAAIAGRGGIIRTPTPFGTVSLEFNAAGYLIGFAAPLTGSSSQDVQGFHIPPNTTGGARLEAPDTASLGFSNPVRTPGFIGAYISPATFSGISFTDVRGAVAVDGVPLGPTSTPSSILRAKLNSNPEAVSAGSFVLDLLKFTSQNASCVAMFGGGQ